MPDVFVELNETGVIQHSSPVPYYFQLTTYIENKIKAKLWHQGQLLPSEQEFCQRFSISRTVVRQAMAELEKRGLVVKQSGKRTSVASPKYDGSLMQNLRGFYEDSVARGQKPTSKVLTLQSLPAPFDVAEALRLPEGESVIMLNRLRFLDDEPEVLVVTYIPERLCPELVHQDLSSQSLYDVLDRKYSLRIARGFRTIEAISAEREEAKLLGVRSGSPLLLLKSIGLLEDGTALEYFVAKHRGDRSKFHVQLVRSERSSGGLLPNLSKG
jgi:GntR family transcriptional regulator